jgi:pyridoxal phosphate enzyme (YggS family)
VDIQQTISVIKAEIPQRVKLIAVSKTKPNDLIMEAYIGGQRVFGENRAMELKQKHQELPKDIEWHFIGHPQSKQVKYFASFVELIHGVDSLKLLKVINKEAVKNSRKINCLLEFHIAQETTKFGMSIDVAKEMLASDEFKTLENINICGVMGMSTKTDDYNLIKSEFGKLKQIFFELKQEFFSDKNFFKEISMGMSNDYNIAIEQGSTMVRIGSKIFGRKEI